MASVNASYLKGLLFKPPGQQGSYDIDGNGKLDRPELAKASLNLMGQEDPNAQNAGRLVATFVQGGKDKAGLLPDFDGDGALKSDEIDQFAGNSQNITSDNFKRTFGDRYQEGGTTLDIPGLQKTAQENLPKFTSDNPQTFGNSLGSLVGGNNPQFMQMLTVVMGMIKQYMGGQSQ
jgi:hypothetical protein